MAASYQAEHHRARTAASWKDYLGAAMAGLMAWPFAKKCTLGASQWRRLALALQVKLDALAVMAARGERQIINTVSCSSSFVAEDRGCLLCLLVSFSRRCLETLREQEGQTDPRPYWRKVWNLVWGKNCQRRYRLGSANLTHTEGL